MLTNYERETYFSFNEAESEAVMFTHNASIIRKYKNAMCEYPEIKLVRENEDGSCQFIMPKKWFAPMSNVPLMSNVVRNLLNFFMAHK